MSIFTVPDLGGGNPGPPGPPGAPGTGGVYGSMFAVFFLGFVQQAFVAGVPQKITPFGTNLANNGVTPDQANDRLLILQDGAYEVFWTQSYRGNVSWTWDFLEVRRSGTLIPELSFVDYEGTGPPFSRSSIASSGIVSLSAGDVIEIYGQTSVNVTVDWLDAQFLAWRSSE